MRWPVVPFEELYAEPSRNGVYKPKDAHGRGAKIVNMGEIFNYDFVGPQDMSRLEMSPKELTISGLQNGDLLFGRRSLVEKGAGKCAIALNVSEPTTFESSIIRTRLRQDRCDPLFFYYWFRSPQGRDRIRSIVTGTNIKGIKGSDLKRIPVVCPDLTSQRRVVSVLRLYDDLIEVNRRRIAVLEEMARRLFDEWFVNFRFPGHEGHEVVETMLGKAPNGWRCGVLGDLLTLAYGKALKADTRVAGEFPVIGSSGVVGTHNESLVEGPAIIVGRKGNVGSVIWSDTACYPIDTVFYVETHAPLRFVYQALKRMTFLNSDAAVPGLNRAGALRLNIIIPPAELMEQYQQRVSAMLMQASTLSKINNGLAASRDLLLPRLISGELSVATAERELEAAA